MFPCTLMPILDSSFVQTKSLDGRLKRTTVDQQGLQQVQADEIKVKTMMGSCWMALAMAVFTRLWLGGVVSRKRDLDLIQSLADKVHAIALCRPLLLAADAALANLHGIHTCEPSAVLSGKPLSVLLGVLHGKKVLPFKNTHFASAYRFSPEK